MSRQTTCGFELATTGNPSEYVDANGSAWSPSTLAARTGTYGLRCLASSSFGYVSFNANGHGHNGANEGYFIRVYVRRIAALSAAAHIGSWESITSVNYGVTLRMTVAGALEVWDRQSTPVIIGAASSVLALNTWYRVELAANWTNNHVIARINGVDFVNDNGVHNWGAGGGIEAMRRFKLGLGTNAVAVTSGEIHFDDFAWNDTTTTAGPVNQNSWPGPGNVVYIKPDGAGNSNLGVFTGAGNFADVAETPPDTTTYWTGDVAADTVELNCTACGITGHSSIPVIQVGCIVRALTAASCSYASRIRSNASSVNGSTIAIQNTTFISPHDDTTDFMFPSGTWYVDPNGSVNWTVAALDALQIGLIVPDATPDVLCTRVWCMIDYVPITEFPAAGPGAPPPFQRAWRAYPRRRRIAA